MKPKGYWTYEKCKEASLICKTKIELKTNYNAAYKLINKNNWVELTSHFIEGQKPKNYWTYEKCKEVSLECKTKTELKIKYCSAYNKIYMEKWLELLSHLEKVGNKYKRLIYVYEFPDNHCYIGLTGNIYRRNKQHYGEEKYHKSSVFNYITKTNLKPKLVLKSEYINVNDAVLLEEKILNEYKDKGWITLNEAKTGNIGSKDIKWTLESCINEVKKYNSLKDFIKYSASAYTTIHYKGWNSILSPIRTRQDINFWNDKEKCRIESKKYRNLTEFANKCWMAYNHSKNNNWLIEFFDIKPKVPTGYWNNKEKCKIESEKYKNIGEFSKKSSSAYRYSKKNNWLIEFFGIKYSNGYWNDKEKCRIESIKYKNRKEFGIKCWSAYNYSKINFWIDEFFPKNKSR